jgi:triacylglycerol lipase
MTCTPLRARTGRRTVLRIAFAGLVALCLGSGSGLRAEVTSGSVVAPGGTMVYLKSGSGPALVIVHGVGGHKEDWQGVMAALSGARTVYAVDMLGFGGSTRDAPDLTMAAQSAALLALMDAEGIAKADLLGNSVGGWVTATLAADHPDRVDRLILADVAGFKAMFEGEPPVNFFPGTLEEMQKLLSYVLYSDFAQTPEFAAQALAALQASGEPAIAGTLFAGLGASPRLEEVLPKITVPTLVIWGAEDKLFPVALAPYLTGLTPGATSVIIEKAGHFPQVDNPEAFIAAVKAFLEV